MKWPALPPMRMNAADTSASRAIADCTPLAVVSRSWTTAEIDTFISDVSTTSTNIAIASRIARRVSPLAASSAGTAASTLIGASSLLRETAGRERSREERRLLVGPAAHVRQRQPGTRLLPALPPTVRHGRRRERQHGARVV